MSTIYRYIIGLYRRHLSPYKGFRCAYAVYHHAPSCSMVAESILVEHGMLRGLPLIQAQFRACRGARDALLEARYALINASDESDVQEDKPQDISRRRKRDRRRQRSCWGDLGPSETGCCDDVTDGIYICDIAECAASNIEFPSCDSPLGDLEIGSCGFD